MIERRRHKRVSVDFWVSLSHPLLGVATAEIQNMSSGGLSVTLDEEIEFFVMMELEARIHGEGWDDSMPSLPVQVVRILGREVALSFLDDCDYFLNSAVKAEFSEEEFEFDVDEELRRMEPLEPPRNDGRNTLF